MSTANRGGTTASRMPIDVILTDDGELPCQPPDDCSVCGLWPREGEPMEAYLKRLGDLYRLAPDGHELRRKELAG